MVLKQKEDAEAKLINSLKNNNPILFVGAGFSRNAVCNGSILPSSNELRDILFDHFYIKNRPTNVDDDDISSISEYDLARLCDSICGDDRSAQLNSKLIEIFKGSMPARQDPYHEMICDYSWSKIYTLNIDDLLENIFSSKGIEYVVQNESKMKPHNNCCQIFKLHGCVNNPDEGFVFSDSEYIRRMANNDYRSNEFAYDYFKNDIIFLGTEYDEADIKLIIQQNIEMGYQPNQCNYFFVSPSINHILSQVISRESNYYYIQWDAKKFLEECSKLEKNEKNISDIEKMLEQRGFLQVKNFTQVPDSYESKLYLGNRVVFYDIMDNWDVQRTTTLDICKKIELSKGGFITVVCGDRFCGKSVAAHRLLVELYKKGYSAFLYNCEGKDELDIFHEYLSRLTQTTKIAVLIDDAAYIYEDVCDFIQKLPKHIDSLVFILVSETKKHFSKEHELQGVNALLWKIVDELDDKLPNAIYNKLAEKNRLGKYRGYDKFIVINKIKKENSLIEFLFKLTFGIGFKVHFKKLLDEFISCASPNEMDLFKQVLIMTKLGIYNIREEQLYLSPGKCNIDNLEKIITGFKSSRGINLRGAKAYDEFLYLIPENERADIVYKLVTRISNRFRENVNNRWKNIFEQLLRYNSLKDQLRLNGQTISSLFARLEKCLSDISYFWMQRGLAKQDQKKYDEADGFLEQALSIRPNSYKIRHAIAHNKLKQAVDMIADDRNNLEAVELFKMGIDELIELISKPQFSHNIGYSVNTYIIENLNYHRLRRMRIPEEQIKFMHSILMSAAEQNYDYYIKTCRSRLFNYCLINYPQLAKLFGEDAFSSYTKYTYADKA